jgi:hypothetical protein
MEEALELSEYLPVSFKSPSERDYIGFLWDAFDSNCDSGKYQFAFLAYHMLTMSFVYFKVWQIRESRNHEFRHGLIGFGKEIEKNLLETSSPFSFSVVNERSILRFLKLIECDNGEIGSYAKLVDDRNDTAHPNGNVFYREAGALEIKIREVLRAVNGIQERSQPVIEGCYEMFLRDSADPDQREFEDDADQVREVLIHGNYLSARDIKVCATFDMGKLASDPVNESAQALHQALIAGYAED